jgi:RNA polymerase sigma factor (sigma-70 family)
VSRVHSHSVTNLIKAVKSRNAGEWAGDQPSHVAVPQVAHEQLPSATENCHAARENQRSQIDPEQAVKELWDRYYSRLVELARKNSAGLLRGDDEQAALDALLSGFAFLARENWATGRVNDRDELWRLLIRILMRKLGKQRRIQAAAKRGSGNVRNASAFADADGSAGPLDLAVGREPPPEFRAIWNDLICQLGPNLQVVAEMTLHGYTQLEIAKTLDCSPRTITRQLTLIRETFRQNV